MDETELLEVGDLIRDQMKHHFRVSAIGADEFVIEILKKDGTSHRHPKLRHITRRNVELMFSKGLWKIVS
jgi:hypothetical protein